MDGEEEVMASEAEAVDGGVEAVAGEVEVVAGEAEKVQELRSWLQFQDLNATIPITLP